MIQELKPFSELKKEVLEKLYLLRLPELGTISFEDYSKWYSFIVVDEVPYGNEKCDKWIVSQYFKAKEACKHCWVFPDAIITEGKVFKNKFGYHE